MKIGIVAYLILVIASTGCEKEVVKPTPKTQFEYAFFGHTYKTSNEIDERLAILDKTQFDQLWLGGDICGNTTEEYETLTYLDNLFDLSSQQTHWTLGNHDVKSGNAAWIQDFTNRPSYYTTHFNGITLIVMNTQLSYNLVYDTLNMNRQYEMIQAVCDTIEASSHLIVMSHFAMWKNIDTLRSIENLCNADFSWLRLRLQPDKKFHDGIYPMLQKARNNGVEVIYLAGDFGQKTSRYEAKTTDDIQFIGSGITANTPWNSQFPTEGQPDYYLVLKHNTLSRTIDWEFRILE